MITLHNRTNECTCLERRQIPKAQNKHTRLTKHHCYNFGYVKTFIHGRIQFFLNFSTYLCFLISFLSIPPCLSCACSRIHCLQRSTKPDVICNSTMTFEKYLERRCHGSRRFNRWSCLFQLLSCGRQDYYVKRFYIAVLTSSCPRLFHRFKLPPSTEPPAYLHINI